MGTFYVEISVGDAQGQRWQQIEALVDTGASLTSVAASVLQDLGVRPLYTERFRFAQGEVREMPFGETRIRLAGKEFTTQFVFNEEGTPALLGALALEGAFLAVDPVGQKLIPVEGLLMTGFPL